MREGLLAQARPETFTQRFAALDDFLLEHQQLWRSQPFTELQLDWEAQHPQLSGWLRRQSLEQAAEHQLEPWQLASRAKGADTENHFGAASAPEPFVRWARHAQALSAVEPLPVYHPAKLLPEPMQRGIPGRKWQQIEAFAACLPKGWQSGRWLDWCAGKGHLGRYLAWPADRLCCIEYDPVLAEAGQGMSAAWQVQASHPCSDAMEADVLPHLEQSDNLVALHACGDLHTRLLQWAAELPVQRLAVAPCCYNRIRDDSYQPFSAAGRSSRLKLDVYALGLPLQTTVTAGAGEVRRRDREQAWRLGFDLLQRDWRGVDQYLPVPSRTGRAAPDFAAWCHAAAREKHIVPRPVANWASAEQKGWQRLAQVRNLERVSGLFRRPLELWLLMDMALYLQEQDFAVQLGSFCPQTLTPRNLMLLAQRIV